MRKAALYLGAGLILLAAAADAQTITFTLPKIDSIPNLDPLALRPAPWDKPHVYVGGDSTRLTMEMRKALRDGIGEYLFDPYSAQYTYDAISYQYDATGFVGYVCGTVNAKNRFGGYVGVHPYALRLEARVLTGGIYRVTDLDMFDETTRNVTSPAPRLACRGP